MARKYFNIDLDFVVYYWGYGVALILRPLACLSTGLGVNSIPDFHRLLWQTLSFVEHYDC